MKNKDTICFIIALTFFLIGMVGLAVGAFAIFYDFDGMPNIEVTK